MKEKALTTTNHVAISSSLQEIQNDVATQMNLPPQETIVKSLNGYKRKIANAHPNIPHGKDFQIPEEFKEFVAFDKGKDEPERFIIFALTEMLLLLETTKVLWLGDGTFKQRPDMFYQLYTIHVTIGGYNPPCIYALLPNKTKKTYHDFTQALLQLIPNANREGIMMDFEKAAVNAFSTTFPAAQITGCYFHLCQSVLRKINEVGLKKAHTTPPELALASKMAPATAFLPVEHVEDGFNIVMEEVGDMLLRLKSDDEVSEKVEQFVCYFQKTYIRGTSRAPLFEPSI